jgi:hypothetical protein
MQAAAGKLGGLFSRGEFPMESEWTVMFRQIRQPNTTGNSIALRADSSAPAREDDGERQTIDAFRAALRALFGVQCLSGRNLTKPFLFISYSETDSEGRPILTETIRRGITRGSDNLPMRIVWIEDRKDAGRGGQRQYIPSGGAAIRFTVFRNEKSEVTLVGGIINRWGMEPRGFALEVEKRGGFSMVRSSNQTPVD